MLALRALFLYELMRSLVYRGIGEISTHQQEKFCNEAELRMLLCKQAAKIFQTICKKETALKRVLRNLLSAISFAQI